ncbi:hypothetical protein AB833_04300 [Chromatiales bacterium (ex Bugula neritina AB1)]|nr:hypothetical protein AB833_04300 [Chromatiales bacterium (ex Bugula neritina AB1)]
MVELTLGQHESTHAKLGFAGDTLNTAVYLKRLLGNSATVSFTTVLGRDPLSTRLVNFLHSESIDTSTISYSADRLVGLYAITTDSDGERTFSYWRNQSAARTLFQTTNTPDFSVLNEFDVLCLSAITLAILPADIRLALLNYLATLRQEKNTLVVFDSNYRQKLWESKQAAQRTISDAWRITDIALPSVDDETDLFADNNEAATISRLKNYGITRGALKRGAKGPLSLENNYEQSPDPAIYTPENYTVVDTTAAGDSFNAGYLSALVQGENATQALQSGHQCAVRVIAHSGAIVPADQWRKL